MTAKTKNTIIFLIKILFAVLAIGGFLAFLIAWKSETDYNINYLLSQDQIKSDCIKETENKLNDIMLILIEVQNDVKWIKDGN